MEATQLRFVVSPVKGDSLQGSIFETELLFFIFFINL